MAHDSKIVQTSCIDGLLLLIVSVAGHAAWAAWVYDNYWQKVHISNQSFTINKCTVRNEQLQHFLRTSKY